MMTLQPTIAVLMPQILLGARRLGDASRPRVGGADTGEIIFYLVIAAVVIATVCVALFVASRVHHGRLRHSQGMLFSALCRIHHLSRRERALLRQLAARSQLAYPAQVFTEPKWLDTNRLRGQEAELAKLRQQLFGDGT
ncbi:MAG: hypothetical protein JXB62_06825 [Pirellulales bacterium]|nr:hypothetical protein [Pirellulales bacterium]